MPKFIELTRGMVTVVDDEDYEWLSQFSWCAVKGRGDSYYASRAVRIQMPDGSFRPSTRQMQRDLLDPEMKLSRSRKVDHRNGDTLDNRRANLRISSDSQSNANRVGFSKNGTGFKGIDYRPKSRPDTPYVPRIRFKGRIYYGKAQPDAVAAAREYNRLAVEFFGEFARLNIIPGETTE